MYVLFLVLARTTFLLNELRPLQYRDGFVVDDGPYRRLDDPENADFLRSLAAGRTPRELQADGDAVVGLIDKRNQDYVETFQSFSGTGASLGTTTRGEEGIFDPAQLTAAPAVSVNDSQPVTSIQVRLLNGQRVVIRINLSATVTELVTSIVQTAATNPRNTVGESFRLVAGFPPKPLTDETLTVEAAGLKGSQVSLQKS
jgi:UBX domain-containing protein 1